MRERRQPTHRKGKPVDRLSESFEASIAKGEPPTLTGIEKALAPRVKIPTEFLTEAVSLINASMQGQFELEERRRIDRLTLRAARNGWPATELADRLQTTMGLGQRYTNAVENYRQGLLRQGVRPGVARQRARDYGDRLRASRAKTTARFELVRTINTARRLDWESRADELQDYVREWVLSKGACPTCRPMAGLTARVGTMWNTPVGIFPNPPLHPNCRCYEKLVKA